MIVGVVTHFNKSVNYGGVLQAYALTKKLNNLGYEAEQICYDARCKNLDSSTAIEIKPLKKLTIRRILGAIKRKVKRLIFYKRIKTEQRIIFEKQKCFRAWIRVNVKSSNLAYGPSNVCECNNLYDAFITGSDQVWNYTWYDKNYFLDFANNSKIKLSYAASLGHNEIPNGIKEVYSKHLKSFNAVSVREQNMVDLLKDVSPVNVEWVVDPVFLLDKNEWESIALSQEKINDKYIFCYFFGENKKEREIVKEYARQKNLKIVLISDLIIEQKVKLDESFADIKLKNINPGEFLYLIKNAEYIFTDSFHATAFSLIFQKQFFVFNRYSNGGMSDRITSVTNLFNVSERFCAGINESLEYVNSLKDIDYNNNQSEFKKLKEKSINYIQKSLGE
ncbi:MAG: polysaccharide pyruvyl transferase family protein [Clostridia bacterium]|nr:polysaccharide pyruvyl transferase family protein [Clostridia bacterium]